MDEPVVAEWLLLVTEIRRAVGGSPLVLEQPLIVHPGQRHWLDEDERLLFVQELGGKTRSYPCWFATGPDASR
ncbi:hypothetical protein GCM10009593_22550 [Microlunatus antarcticus]